MPTWRPDPTFYPSPRAATQAPPEELAYVVRSNPADDGRPDAMCVVDVNPSSSTYGSVTGQTEMTSPGDELHHFGWNACSSMLCPNSPHPHGERRYLVVPSLGSSRVYILDTKPDPSQPKLVKTIEPEEIAARAGYAKGHTVHCGPDGIYVSALGAPDGDGPGGIFMLDHDTFDVLGRWEIDRGDQYLHYDFWWHLGHDTMVTSEWGTPNMVQTGVQPDLLLEGKYGHQLHFWNLRNRRKVETVDLGKEHQIALELRPAHDPTKAYGFVNSVVSLTDLSSSIWLWHRANGSWAAQKIITIPAEPADEDQLPPALKPFKAVPPLVTDIDLSVDDRFLYVSCWGTGELKQFDVSDPFNPEGDRFRPHRRHRRPRRSSWSERVAQRRAADGRDQPRWPPHLLHQLALSALGRAVLPRWHQRLDGQARRRPGRRHRIRLRLLCRLRRPAAAPDPAARGRRLQRLVLLPIGDEHATKSPRVSPEERGVSSHGTCEPCRRDSSFVGTTRCGVVTGSAMDIFTQYWPWLTVALLGAFHGLNPGMGWLFAVALGLQERRGRAVVAALGPIALGHAASIALIAIPVGLLGLVLPSRSLLMLGGMALLGFAAFKVITRFRHPRWVGMRVGPRDLILWSFLMATAHGSGLMLAPAIALLTGAGSSSALAADHSVHLGHGGHTAVNAASAALAPTLIGAALHSGAMLVVMGVIAILVYHVVGVELLRRAWVNLDLVWVGALAVAGAGVTRLGPLAAGVAAKVDRPTVSS